VHVQHIDVATLPEASAAHAGRYTHHDMYVLDATHVFNSIVNCQLDAMLPASRQAAQTF
jgi:hypothetical protein